MAQQRDFTRVVGASGGGSLGVLGTVSINANAGSTSSTTGNLGGTTTGVDTTVNIADLSATISGIAFAVSAFDATARVSYNPATGFQATTTCSLLSGQGTAQFKVAGASVTINADCSYTPIGIPGVLTVSSTKSVNCQTGPYGQVCTASVCVLDVNVLSTLAGVNSIHVCLGKAQASADFKPATSTGGIIVTSQIPSPTFFLGVVGAHTTNRRPRPPRPLGRSPTSRRTRSPPLPTQCRTRPPRKPEVRRTATAATARWCRGATTTVWGSGMDGNDAMEKQLCPLTPGTSCWRGKLAAGSQHAVGQFVTAASGSGTGPNPLISGSRYLLLPVIEQDGKVRQYGLFAATSDDYIFTLARTADPTTNPVVVAPIAQATTTSGWMPNDEGAVSTKLVDPSYFNATGWS